jgi:hypothetical protein
LDLESNLLNCAWQKQGVLKMPETIVEKVLAEIQSLSPAQLEELRRAVDERLQTLNQSAQLSFTPKIVGKVVPPKDRSKEYEWLNQHRNEYAGQWVALDGDRLLGHGSTLKEVAESARQAGVKDALIVRAEPSNAPPHIGM